MPNTPRSALAAATLATLLAACGGQGRDDGLVDGAVDRPVGESTRAAAEDVGPPSPSSAAAGPAAGGPATDASAAAAAGTVTLTLATQGTHGAHLTDSSGAALYHLEGDRDGSRCTGDCLTAWPPVLAGTTQPAGGAGLQGAMVASIARPDGSRQVTYNGHPLYRYAADGGAGSANGHGVKDQYGTWHLVSPQGSAVAASPAPR